MSLKKCSSCSNDIEKKLHVCPRCGSIQKVSVSPVLAMGILALPMIFSWVTLKIGYSRNTKVIAFSWMVVYLVIFSVKTEVDREVESEIPVAESGVLKTYTESDIYWTKNTLPYKDVVVAGVNKIHKENRNCKVIDPSSVDMSLNKGTKNNPVFYVTCGNVGESFNVFFSKSDVQNNLTLKEKSHIGKGVAVTMCENYAKQNATHPSTVDFSKILDLVVNELPNGNTVVISSFTAKNSFNLELKYSISCTFDDVSMVNASINESK